MNFSEYNDRYPQYKDCIQTQWNISTAFIYCNSLLREMGSASRTRPDPEIVLLNWNYVRASCRATTELTEISVCRPNGTIGWRLRRWEQIQHPSDLHSGFWGLILFDGHYFIVYTNLKWSFQCFLFLGWLKVTEAVTVQLFIACVTIEASYRHIWTFW